MGQTRLFVNSASPFAHETCDFVTSILFLLGRMNSARAVPAPNYSAYWCQDSCLLWRGHERFRDGPQTRGISSGTVGRSSAICRHFILVFYKMDREAGE